MVAEFKIESPLENLTQYNIGIIGLGYVGLPLAVEFAKKYKVTGFDINPNRVEELNRLEDSTHEANLDDLKKVTEDKGEMTGLKLSSAVESLKNCTVFIITVPTPISQFKTPDLSQLFNRLQDDRGAVKKR